MENAWGQEPQFKVHDHSMCANGHLNPAAGLMYHVRRKRRTEQLAKWENYENSTRLYTDLSSNWCNWGRSGKGDIPDECVWVRWTIFPNFDWVCVGGFGYWVYLLRFCLQMLFIDNSFNCYYFLPNKEIVHPKNKISWKCIYPEAIQTVNE